MKLFKRFAAALSAAAVCGMICAPVNVRADHSVIELIPETGGAVITVRPDKDNKMISPYIYGINDTGDIRGISPSVIKNKGSELTTYNWEANCSNTGAAGKNINDMHLVDDYPSNKWNTPALYADKLVSRGIMHNIPQRLVTLPMMGYVAKDSMGIVSDDEQSKDSRWCRVLFNKNDSYLNQPDSSDGVVYADEYISFLVNRFGASGEGGISGYFLDSEPDRWRDNFPVLDLPPITFEELAKRSAELAGVVKTIDGNAVVYGPSLSGLQGCINLRNPSSYSGNEYSWFVDYYLNVMRAAGEKEGMRLLDAFDVHYYTEAAAPTGEKVISGRGDYSNVYRMQSVRTLWDPEYTENDETVIMFNQFTPVIPTLQASIRMNYPGTKLSFSEYDFGGGDNISGAVAEADALGVFASYDVYMACLSPTSKDYDFQKAALNLFTDYDGSGSGFGDTLVYSDNKDDIMSSVYAAKDSGSPEKLRIILTNKQVVNSKDFSVRINSDKYSYELESAYCITDSSSFISEMTLDSFDTDSSGISFTADSTGVYLLVLSGTAAGDTSADASDGEEMTEADETLPSAADTEAGTAVSDDVATELPMPPVTDGTAPSAAEIPPEEDGTAVCETYATVSPDDVTEATEAINPYPPEDAEPAVPAAVKVIISAMSLSVIGGVIYILFFDRK